MKKKCPRGNKWLPQNFDRLDEKTYKCKYCTAILVRIDKNANKLLGHLRNAHLISHNKAATFKLRRKAS